MINTAALKKRFPLIETMIDTKEVFWISDNVIPFEAAKSSIPLTDYDVTCAEKRLERFSSYISKAFPETMVQRGIIESPLVEITAMKQRMVHDFKKGIFGRLMLKCDSDLAVAGSIKARGGIYEVLNHAEDLALEHNLLKADDDYGKLDSDEFRSFYSNYSIAVGSTGNLGLSIGIMGAKLGFKVSVHMSSDAKEWKKELLRSKGVDVIEYASDYSKAVEEGRNEALSSPNCYFVDDENSQNLFLGYAVAARRLKAQLDQQNITVDSTHPLFVYLPCGVGGAPGGVAFGLKLIYGDDVHIFFAEPTHSPCMLLGCMTGLHDSISVQDIGIDNVTVADGLAVGRPSGFVGRALEKSISGIYTVSDDMMLLLLGTLADCENRFLEPSALAGLAGPMYLFNTVAGERYLKDNCLYEHKDKITHIAWATGGSMVPKNQMDEYISMAESLQD